MDTPASTSFPTDFPTEDPQRAAKELLPVGPISDPVPPVPPSRRDTSQPLQVLHLINGEHYSGAERVQDLLALRLPELGYQVTLAALKKGRFGETRQSVDTPLVQLPMRSRFDWRTVGAVIRLTRQKGVDLLHAHTPRTAIVAALAAHQTGVPWVYHVHSPVSLDSERRFQNQLNAMAERWSLRSAAHTIVVSPTLLPYMQRRGVAQDHLSCVPNGVPASQAPRPAGRRSPQLTLGMVALFRPRKGIETLLDALGILQSRGVAVRLRAIGGFESKAYEAQIHEQVARQELPQRVEFVGFTSNVAHQLQQLDALVLPSLYGEGLPMVVLEAMAAGVPVIASRVEGVTLAIEHRQTGLLVEPGNATDLATTIEELASDEVDYQALAAAAQARHAERFSDLAMARGVATVYRQVLAATRRRS